MSEFDDVILASGSGNDAVASGTENRYNSTHTGTQLDSYTDAGNSAYNILKTSGVTSEVSCIFPMSTGAFGYDISTNSAKESIR